AAATEGVGLRMAGLGGLDGEFQGGQIAALIEGFVGGILDVWRTLGVVAGAVVARRRWRRARRLSRRALRRRNGLLRLAGDGRSPRRVCALVLWGPPAGLRTPPARPPPDQQQQSEGPAPCANPQPPAPAPPV